MDKQQFLSGVEFCHHHTGNTVYVYMPPSKPDSWDAGHISTIRESVAFGKERTHHCNVEKITATGIHVYTVVVGRCVKAFRKFSEFTVKEEVKA